MMIYFTGHEKESDLAEGIYTTEYRLYDARVGRWLSVDPLWEKYVGMSPYNYCAGNPVKLVDPDGREISDEESNIKANIIINNASAKIKVIEKEMKEYPESCDLNEMNAQISQLQKTIQDVKDMRKDNDFVYKFIKTSEGNWTEPIDDKNIGVYYSTDDVLVHEIRHAGQYARKDMRIVDCEGSIKTHDYNIDMEIDAYKAQVAYNGELRVPMYLESPNFYQIQAIQNYGESAGLNMFVDKVNDIDVDFIWSIRDTGKILGKFQNSRRYGSW